VSEHYNWRNTLRDFARISGVLAGFCVAFIGLVLGWSLASERLFGNITFGNIKLFLYNSEFIAFNLPVQTEILIVVLFPPHLPVSIIHLCVCQLHLVRARAIPHSLPPR